MNHQQQLLDTALTLARGGWYVYPLSLLKGSDGKKTPDVRVSWKRDSTRDEQQIHDWFDQPRMGMQGLAIDCGKSGVTVVDLDVSGAKQGDQQWADLPWSETSSFTATSVSGGKHLFFRDPKGIKTTAGVIAPDVDIRSTGGTVFCAPTEFCGSAYRFDVPIVPVTALPELPATTRAGIETAYAAKGEKANSRKPTDLPDGIVMGVSHARELVDQALLRFDLMPHWNSIFGYAAQRFKLEVGLAVLDGTQYDGDAVEQDIRALIHARGPWDNLNEQDYKHIRDARMKSEADPWVIVSDEDLSADIDPRAPLVDLYRFRAPKMPGDPYRDQASAANAVIDVLADRYLFAKGLGWLEWNGTEWAHGDKMLGSPINDVRVAGNAAKDRAKRFTQGMSRNRQYRDMQARLATLKAERGKNDPTEEEQKLEADLEKMKVWSSEWTKYSSWWESLGVRRNFEDVLRFVEADPGRIRVLASSLDSNPYLLNCPNGAIDLRTGELRDHDPRDLVTMNTGVEYRPDTTSKMWDKAREAFTPGVEPWLQRKVGEGAFGFPPRDDTILFCFGQGSNGKSSLTDALTYALGDYVVILHDKAILGNEHDHSTEKMVFRGARWTILEELPEAQVLRPALIKKLVGTSKITARAMRQDNVTFDATHHILVNSNHRPQVLESDHGTWRRLVSVPWVYTFRKPAQCVDDFDRPVDTKVRKSLRVDDTTRQAVLAWVVVGAVAFWQDGEDCGERPEAVVNSTQAWRDESDVFGGFFEDRLAFERDHVVSSKELMDELNEYLGDMGKRPVSENYVSTRIMSMPAAKGVHTKNVRKAQKGITVSSANPATHLPERFRGWVGVRWKKGEELT